MAKKSQPVYSVKEILSQLTVTPNEKGKIIPAKFSKDKFNSLMRAIFNDPDYTFDKAVVANGELVQVDHIAVSKGFRKFCKHLLEKYGVDSAESEKVMTSDFTVDSVDGLYEFFTAAMYEYINAGNKYDFIPTEDFRGSVYLKRNPESSKESEVYQPRTRDYLGTYKTTKKKHKVLAVKSSCPKYLRERKKMK